MPRPRTSSAHRSALIQALKRRSDERHTIISLPVVWEEINTGPDRVVAIVWGTLVEDHLRLALGARMGHLTFDESEAIFEVNGPAGDFSGKIKLPYAMNAICRDSKDDLNIIREVRNAFAHTQKPLSFDEQQVKDLCLVISATGVRERFNLPETRPRMIFGVTCFHYWSRFWDMASEKRS